MLPVIAAPPSPGAFISYRRSPFTQYGLVEVVPFCVTDSVLPEVEYVPISVVGATVVIATQLQIPPLSVVQVTELYIPMAMSV
jgi:hypothetical protein